MPGVYLEYIKAGKFVVPVELTFQTETIKAPGDIRGLVSTSKWIERHNWKEIKAMLKPAVEACLKYNETPLDNIPKSHHISYGREVSLGYLIVPNKISSFLISVLDTKKSCWTDDEDDEDELLGIQGTVRMEDHGSEFTDFIVTKTAIRVCVVRKSVVSIDDARRIRKELGVRSEDVRNYFSSANHAPNDPGSSATHNPENFDKEKWVSEWAASAIHSNLRDSGRIGLTRKSTQSSCGNLFNSNQSADGGVNPTNGTTSIRNDLDSDSEVENIPRTFGDPDEIRDAARIYPLVLTRDVDSGEDPDDDLSLPDIEPNPPTRKKSTRTRKKSASLSPSKSKRLTHANILAISHEGQATFSEEDTTYNKRGPKKGKRKRTVAVVEPMRTLPNGQVSFEHAIGALSSDKRRKARPGSSHGTDKAHSGGSRSKQPPAIDILDPVDDRLTIPNPPEPLPVASTSTTRISPFKEAERHLEIEMKRLKRRKRRKVNIDDDPHKHERLTPSPLFSSDDGHSRTEEAPSSTSTYESDLEMPVLTKMVESGDEEKQEESSRSVEASSKQVETCQETVDNGKQTTNARANESHEDVVENETPVLSKESNDITKASPDITQIKAHANVKKKQVTKKTFKRKLTMPSAATETRKSKTELNTPKTVTVITVPESVETPPSKDHASSVSNTLSPDPKLPTSDERISRRSKETTNSACESELEANANKTSSPVQANPPITSPLVTEVRRPGITPVNDTSKLKETQKRKKTRNIRKKRKKSVATEKEMKVKPQMSDGQTQTDELTVALQTEQTHITPICNTVFKVSRSMDVSSDDEAYEMASQKSSGRSLLASPLANSETSMSAANNTAISHYHPALGSPETDLFDDDGLFSFESPTIPDLSSSQISTEAHEGTSCDNSLEVNYSPGKAYLDPKENENAVNDSSDEETMQPPTSPQPGCSHWLNTPFNRPLTPPTATMSNLMPPPVSRPPRTPRKLFESGDESRSRLSAGSPEPTDVFNDTEEIDSESDAMPVGAEAVPISENVGRIYEVLQQPSILKAGMRLIQKVASKEISAQELENTLKLGSKDSEDCNQSSALLPAIPQKRNRALSPDICDVVPDSRVQLAIAAARRSRKDSFDESRNSNRIAEDQPQNSAVILRNIASEDETSDTDGANEKLLEVLSRMGSDPAATYEPHGDEFDLSQRSYCMLNVVPQYDLKSRLYKIHAKAVRETPVRVILDHYHKIQNDLFGIFRGTIPSTRHDIFVRGIDAKSELRNINVTLPFTGEQSSALITMVYDKLVPDKRMRCDYMDYINYVLVPETFIRIYSRINNTSHHQAEIEMRFRACYGGNAPQQYLPCPPLD